MRGRNKKYWVDLLPTLRKGLDGKIEKALRVSYDGLERKEHKSLFRHISCFFNGDEVSNIKSMLADSDLNVDIGLEILVDKSLIHVIPSLDRTNIVEMHSLVEEMGKEIVRAQSDEPGEREFLIDLKDVCDVLEDGTGTKKIIGISLNVDEIDELPIHKKAFKGMKRLRFLNIYTKKWDQKKEVRWHLHEGFKDFPPKLRLLRWDGCPMKRMPSSFCPQNLVKIQMQGSKLETLWGGIHSLTGLKKMDLRRSTNLKEIPDLSMATNLKTLNLAYCSSLVELPSFIQFLSKLKELEMSFCENLEILPTGMNLKYLKRLSLRGCSRLKSFPNISSNIPILKLSETAIEEFLPNLRLENLVELEMWRMKSEKLWGRVQPLTPLMAMLSSSLTKLSLSDIPTLVELPSSFENLNKLETLSIINCINLETLPNGINLRSLDLLNMTRCSRLRSFPDISTNISKLFLSGTWIHEVPWWIENFSNLILIRMWECKNLKHVSLNTSKMKHLQLVDFLDCGALTEASLNDSPSAVAMATDSYHSNFSPSLQEDHCTPNIRLNFANCFNLNQEALIEKQTVSQEQLVLPGEEVPSFFTHQASGTSSSLTTPLLPSSLLQPFFRFRVCAVLKSISSVDGVDIHVNCRFKDRFENISESFGHRQRFWATHKDSHLFIMDCCFPLNKDNAPPIAKPTYDHVDIQLQISTNAVLPSLNYGDSTLRLKRWGVRLLNDYSSAEKRLGNINTLPHVCEADEDNMVDDECNETEQGDEYGDSLVETERCRKRMRTT